MWVLGCAITIDKIGSHSNHRSGWHRGAFVVGLDVDPFDAVLEKIPLQARGRRLMSAEKFWISLEQPLQAQGKQVTKD
jgi:hypothetical protein